LKLSPALAKFVGEKEMARPHLLRYFWVYFRNNGLVDPENRRSVLCDRKLKKLFGTDSFDLLGLNKLVSEHTEAL
jgi:upstream activation factor subunit UAF30